MYDLIGFYYFSLLVHNFFWPYLLSLLRVLSYGQICVMYSVVGTTEFDLIEFSFFYVYEKGHGFVLL